MFKPDKTRSVPYHWIILTWMLLHASVGLAAKNALEENIQVQANYMQFDIKTGSSVYEGDVKISQGNIQLLGQKVTILRQQDQIQEINVDGQPAQYSQDENTENKIYATSQHMQYLTDQHRLVMTINARLEQPDHTIESQRIVYDTKNKTVIAGSDDQQAQPGGRVNITLTPKKDNTTAPTSAEQP